MLSNACVRVLRKYVIFKFLIVMALLMVYFIIDLAVVEMNFHSNIDVLLDHCKHTLTRSSLLRYYENFLQEGVIALSPLRESTSSTTTLQ